jgi:uncharacterized Zn finger protein
MAWRDDSWGRYYPRSRPRQAKGGIKARSQRGEFGTSWWAKRWIEVLHGFQIGARLDRGRSYARKGQVLNIEIAKGEVHAQVQGSRPTPYNVTIKTQMLANSDWEKVVRRLADQAFFAAKLLAGEMPQDIERAFQDVGVSLFPVRRNDLSTNCSCPDWSNPCKHVAAVYYLLGEEFDRDPFLIFTLRGLTREELFEQLERAGGRAVGNTTEETEAVIAEAVETDPASAPRTPEPRAADPTTFWRGQELSDDFLGEVANPPVAAALPKRLGGFPFWRGDTPFLNAIEPVYSAASLQAIDVFLNAQSRDNDEQLTQPSSSKTSQSP